MNHKKLQILVNNKKKQINNNKLSNINNKTKKTNKYCTPQK